MFEIQWNVVILRPAAGLQLFVGFVIIFQVSGQKLCHSRLLLDCIAMQVFWISVFLFSCIVMLVTERIFSRVQIFVHGTHGTSKEF